MGAAIEQGRIDQEPLVPASIRLLYTFPGPEMDLIRYPAKPLPYSYSQVAQQAAVVYPYGGSLEWDLPHFLARA
jgi:hypothetical protein